MQLVEQGKLALDDGDMIESICPELKDVKILKSVDDNGNAELEEKTTKITLRMLLTHTCMLTHMLQPFKANLLELVLGRTTLLPFLQPRVHESNCLGIHSSTIPFVDGGSQLGMMSSVDLRRTFRGYRLGSSPVRSGSTE